MYAQCPHGVARRGNFSHRIIFSNIPQFDFSVPAARHQFSEPASLHVNSRNPLLMPPPMFDHCHCGLFPRVEDSDGPVAVAGAEDVACDLIGGERCDARAGAGRDVLVKKRLSV